MKIVINSCFGGFSLSDFAVKKLGLESSYDSIDRDDPHLVALVEEFGNAGCGGLCAKLEIINLPDTITDWMISEYDGLESIIYVVDGKLYTR